MRFSALSLILSTRAEDCKTRALEKYSKNVQSLCKEEVFFTTLCPITKWKFEIEQIALYWTPVGSNIEYKFVVVNENVLLASSTGPYKDISGNDQHIFY